MHEHEHTAIALVMVNNLRGLWFVVIVFNVKSFELYFEDKISLKRDDEEVE